MVWVYVTVKQTASEGKPSQNKQELKVADRASAKTLRLVLSIYLIIYRIL